VRVCNLAPLPYQEFTLADEPSMVKVEDRPPGMARLVHTCLDDVACERPTAAQAQQLLHALRKVAGSCSATSKTERATISDELQPPHHPLSHSTGAALPRPAPLPAPLGMVGVARDPSSGQPRILHDALLRQSVANAYVATDPAPKDSECVVQYEPWEQPRVLHAALVRQSVADAYAEDAEDVVPGMSLGQPHDLIDSLDCQGGNVGRTPVAKEPALRPSQARVTPETMHEGIQTSFADLMDAVADPKQAQGRAAGHNIAGSSVDTKSAGKARAGGVRIPEGATIPWQVIRETATVSNATRIRI
jgi:hypothetical protein